MAVAATLWTAACSLCLAQQRVYSYTDGNGVRVFTNIPPKGAATAEQPASPTTSNAEALPDGGSLKANVDTIIEKYKDKYRLPPKLVRSMIASESGFNPRAVSRKGAQGLMQLMPETASRLGVKNPFDPDENIRGGMEHMRFLLDTFNNDLDLSLAAYNAGENLVQRLNRVPNFPETKAYVRTVKSRYGHNDMVNQSSQNAPRGPSTFKWVDDQGILHLTNIAPTMRQDSAWSTLGMPAESPQ